MKTKLLRKLRKKFYIEYERGVYTKYTPYGQSEFYNLKSVKAELRCDIILEARKYHDNHRTRKRILV